MRTVAMGDHNLGPFNHIVPEKDELVPAPGSDGAAWDEFTGDEAKARGLSKQDGDQFWNPFDKCWSDTRSKEGFVSRDRYRRRVNPNADVSNRTTNPD